MHRRTLKWLVWAAVAAACGANEWRDERTVSECSSDGSTSSSNYQQGRRNNSSTERWSGSLMSPEQREKTNRFNITNYNFLPGTKQLSVKKKPTFSNEPTHFLSGKTHFLLGANPHPAMNKPASCQEQTHFLLWTISLPGRKNPLPVRKNLLPVRN